MARINFGYNRKERNKRGRAHVAHACGHIHVPDSWDWENEEHHKMIRDQVMKAVPEGWMLTGYCMDG